MARLSRSISLYLIRAIVPYFLFSWLLLSVILFVQQAGRFSDIFFSANIPAKLIWQLSIALIPNVISFTCPMAVLVGVIIGLSKMQADSELTAIRASGVGNIQITAPIILLGILLSIFSVYVNWQGVPLAARMVRQVAIQTAIQKLESPIEPGVFNTEVAGYTIYIKDGDVGEGKWRNIFIHQKDDAAGVTRLITSTSGRIDSTGEASELYLENAVVTTLSGKAEDQKVVSEKVGEVRVAIKTKRGELIEKLGSGDLSPEELGLAQLADYAKNKDGKDKVEAQLIWQRRIVLSITPLLFCLLGASMMLRFNKGGRAFATSLALASLIGYYLLAFLGEQLARTDKIGVAVAAALPITASLAAVFWFSYSGRIGSRWNFGDFFGHTFRTLKARASNFRTRNVFVNLTTGLRDFDILTDLIAYYLLTLAFLATVFQIFTAFELWKFAGSIDGGIVLLGKYLVYLLPFIYIQLSPSAAMVATLATYVIKSRRNEIVTWTSAGQSVYRLLFPCLLAMFVLGAFNYGVRELVIPRANQLQDQYRERIRSRGIDAQKDRPLWVANDTRIYSFSLKNNASDNVIRVSDLTVYDFDKESGRLQTLYHVPEALWDRDRITFEGPGEKLNVGAGGVSRETISGGSLAESTNPFFEIRKKPSQLNSADTRSQIRTSESVVEQRAFAVSLNKIYSNLFLPFVIALFTAPFALSLSRTGKAATVGFAIGLWLIFMSVSSTFEQFGLNGDMSPAIAVWGPLMGFALLGAYLLSRVRT